MWGRCNVLPLFPMPNLGRFGIIFAIEFAAAEGIIDLCKG